MIATAFLFVPALRDCFKSRRRLESEILVSSTSPSQQSLRGTLFYGIVAIHDSLYNRGKAQTAAVDPQETLAESKSRNAAVSRDAEVCYPFCRKHGSTSSETS